MTDDQVVLRLPAASAYLSVLRTATASLASRLDFTVDDIEDLRIAVDEACALLLPHAAEGADLNTTFDLSDEALTVTVAVRTQEPAPLARDSFAWTVLTALAGEVSSVVEGDVVSLRLLKRKAPPP